MATLQQVESRGVAYKIYVAGLCLVCGISFLLLMGYAIYSPGPAF